MTERFARVALPLPLFEPYTYAVPDTLADRVVLVAKGRTVGELLGQRQIRRTIAPPPLAAHTGDRAQYPTTGQQGHDDF